MNMGWQQRRSSASRMLAFPWSWRCSRQHQPFRLSLLECEKAARRVAAVAMLGFWPKKSFSSACHRRWASERCLAVALAFWLAALRPSAASSAESGALGGETTGLQRVGVGPPLDLPHLFVSMLMTMLRVALASRAGSSRSAATRSGLAHSRKSLVAEL